MTIKVMYGYIINLTKPAIIKMFIDYYIFLFCKHILIENFTDDI